MRDEDEQAMIAAIEGRRVVRFLYTTSGMPGVRVCRPHVLYVSGTGRLSLDAIQVAGATTSGDLPGWRLFDAASIGPVQVLDERFGCNGELNLDNRERYVRIVASCEGPAASDRR